MSLGQFCPYTQSLVPSKVVSHFHLNQTIALTVFFLQDTVTERRLHTLDVKRVLMYYIDQNTLFHKSDQLFVSFLQGTV